jgi:hypothetical protein
MIVGITINNILRDHITQITRAYTEVTGEIPIEPINPYKLEDSFPTKEKNEAITEFMLLTDGQEIEEMVYNESDESFNVFDMMYNEASFEIFGRAIESKPNIIRSLKLLEKKCKVEFVLINKESPRSKCATLFFLSKHAFDFNKIYFPDKEKEFWNYADVIISDNPKVLNKKPKNKISIKVENEFNVDIKSDYTIINLIDAKKLKSIIKSIKTSKKTDGTNSNNIE